MGDKKRIRQNLNRLRRIKTWQLVIIFILSCFVSATFLRLNNIGMVERRAAVITADNEGDDKVIQDRLYDLQRYVTSHMNTDMGKGLYLEASYKHDIEKAYPTGNIYKTVQEICMPKFSHWSFAYVQCTTDELAKYPGSTVQWPQADTYLHVFASPLWSPDFAGWSVVISVVIFIMIITRVTGVIILRILLNRHYKSI